MTIHNKSSHQSEGTNDSIPCTTIGTIGEEDRDQGTVRQLNDSSNHQQNELQTLYPLADGGSRVQLGEGLVRPTYSLMCLDLVSFYSRGCNLQSWALQLLPYQCSYGTTEKETLSLVLSLNNFELHVEGTGHPVQVFTDLLA